MRLVPLLALLAHVLAAVGDTSLVCFGADGHVAVEKLRDEHPRVNDSTTISVTRGRVAVLTAHALPRPMPHGPCFDVALEPGSQWRTPSKAEIPNGAGPPLVPAIIVAVADASTSDAARYRLASFQPTTDPALTPLRSTVLRI